MQYTVSNTEEYFKALPEERKAGFEKLYLTIKANLPTGFSEHNSYGHVGFVVPFSFYAIGYHCDSTQPLPFIGLASQKNHIAIYHMGIYMNQEVLDWFTNEFKNHSKKKLDMGKSCIRFKKVEDIPYDLIAELATKFTVEEYVNLYESLLKSKK
ncbi:MAG: DUF1801 domain-containing protein [Weeksellaceae bacterium]|nr:DUF1801 domain-containing protein [Weeksellaceae bacterium]